MVKVLVSVPSKKELTEIGALDFKQKLPNGINTRCDHCGKNISEKEFIFGFKEGYRNFSFHIDCAGQQNLFEETKKSPALLPAKGKGKSVNSKPTGKEQPKKKVTKKAPPKGAPKKKASGKKGMIKSGK